MSGLDMAVKVLIQRARMMTRAAHDWVCIYVESRNPADCAREVAREIDILIDLCAKAARQADPDHARVTTD